MQTWCLLECLQWGLAESRLPVLEVFPAIAPRRRTPRSATRLAAARQRVAPFCCRTSGAHPPVFSLWHRDSEAGRSWVALPTESCYPVRAGKSIKQDSRPGPYRDELMRMHLRKPAIKVYGI